MLVIPFIFKVNQLIFRFEKLEENNVIVILVIGVFTFFLIHAFFNFTSISSIYCEIVLLNWTYLNFEYQKADRIYMIQR